MVILFPMLLGADDLVAIANQIPIHFNFAGQANNFQSKPLVVFWSSYFRSHGASVYDLYDRSRF